MKDRFDLEQEIMSCWDVVNDIDTFSSNILDSPKFKDLSPDTANKICNTLSGIKELYDLRFNKLFDTFKQSNSLDEYRGK